MQPKTEVKFDKKTFNRIKKTIKNMSRVSKKRMNDSSYTLEIPEEFGLQLTNKCNLRCKHCFQWSDDGFFHNLEDEIQRSELDIELVKKIFNQTKIVKSNVYLWGGEPLCYKNWDELCCILEDDPRWTVLCTNGILLEDKIDSITRISDLLAVMISIDGFENENDVVRGIGTFNRIIKNIDLLANLKKKGIFKGEITINCVISELMSDKLYEFLEFFEEKNINTVYLCFPWHISESVAGCMDIYYMENIKEIFSGSLKTTASWHSYSYKLNNEVLPRLKDEINKINRKKWKTRIRLQPALEIDEIEGFINDSKIPAQGKTMCLAVSTRLNVMASGDVTVCKLFPEFIVDNLYNMDLKEVWHGDKFRQFREKLGCGLMPVCSKCILLYLHGI